MKYNLGDNLTAKVKLNRRYSSGVGHWGAWEWSVWEGDECIQRGSFLESEHFLIANDVVEHLIFKYVDEPNMVCGGEDGPSDADSGL